MWCTPHRGGAASINVSMASQLSIDLQATCTTSIDGSTWMEAGESFSCRKIYYVQMEEPLIQCMIACMTGNYLAIYTVHSKFYKLQISASYFIVERKSILQAKYTTGRVKNGMFRPRRSSSISSANEDFRGGNVPGFLLFLLRILLVKLTSVHMLMQQ